MITVFPHHPGHPLISWLCDLSLSIPTFHASVFKREVYGICPYRCACIRVHHSAKEGPWHCVIGGMNNIHEFK